MNIIKLMNAATQGKPQRLYPMIGWTLLEYTFRAAPYCVMLGVVWEVFKPLQYPGTELNVKLIGVYCAALLVCLLLLVFFNYKSYMASYREGYNICADGRISVAEHLRKLSMGFYNTKDPGTIGSYIVSDFDNVELLVTHQLPQIIGGLIGPLVMVISLAFFNWQLALIAALVIPLAWPMVWITRKLIAYSGKKQQKSKTDAASRVIEYIQGIRLIKAFNLGGTKFERLEKSFRKLKQDSIRLEAGSGPTLVLATFVLNASIPLIILVGFYFFTHGEMSLPVYILFLLLGTKMCEPLMQALMFLGLATYMGLSVERIEALRKTPIMSDGSDTGKITNFDIEFKGVDFSYNNVPVVKQLNLKIPSHKLTALVGPSGSGKTTLTRLIARFWDVDKGEIRLNGKNIKDYPVDNLLSCISIVFQDVYLFNDTIYNNIKIGNANATEEQILAAAEKAQVMNFAWELPGGLQAMVGEGGCTLSGGEKQRISIARALLKDAPIVLLDEATASLDPENELHIQEAINELVKSKTVIVIAHRLNTIVHADNIVVLDDGKLSEQGAHQQLLANNGLYKHMWDEQQRMKGWKF